MTEGGRVLVCWPKVPFVRGGAEALVDRLTRELRNQGFEVDTIEIPLVDATHESVVHSAALWRLLDLHQLKANAADLVITTKFPSYYLQHPRKIVWLIHQFRQVYDLYGTPYSGYDRPRPDDYQLLRWIAESDRAYLEEAQAVFTISRNVRDRLKRFLGLDARVLYPPPPWEGLYRCETYEPRILIVQRLEPNKRTRLLLESLARVRHDFQADIFGEGIEREDLEALARDLGIQDQVTFHGRVDEAVLAEAYARTGIVLYAPYDEDYGFVPVEAMKSSKPVVTTLDSGGALEFVRHRETGWVAEPRPESIAEGIEYLLEHPEEARDWGAQGQASVVDLTWSSCIRTLTESLENHGD